MGLTSLPSLWVVANANILGIPGLGFRQFLRKGGEISHIRNSTTKIIIGTWLLATVVLISGYCGVLFSYLTHPVYEKVPTTIKELINAVMMGTYSCGNICSSPDEKLLMGIETGSLKILGDYIKDHPENCVNSYKQGVEYSLNSKFAFFGSRSVINALTKEMGKQLFVLSKDSIINYMIAFTVRKNFTLKQEFDEIIGKLRDCGIYQKFVNDEMPQPKHIEKENFNPLSLEDMMSTFILLASGYAISVLCLIVEHLKILLRV
ncbi:uncharacterized protein [Centruroides vittatus]|uniref:uncharacterized protein n=1 Tax=Centruroides vittatus TaxID=120091 RepID=UPI00350FAD29